MIDRALLSRCAAAFGVEVDAALAERFDTYARLLVEWNEKMNLTAITDPTGIAVKHFADSLTAAPLLPAGEISLIDVGTGAGFPGVPLALLRGDIRLTLLDSLNKRLTFLDALCRALALPVTLIHARAEEGGQRADLRERFDVATARAVGILGARVAEVRETTLSADGETLAHCLVSLDKVKQTPPKYPRNSAKIAKQPL